MSHSKNALLNFEEKYEIGPINPKTGTPCWLWTAAKQSAGGYGYFRWRGVQGYAHRFAWEMWRGEIPAGMTVDHDDPAVGCGNADCVNPDHLALATAAQQKQRQRGVSRNSTSGIRGVHWDSARQKWAVRTQHNSRKYTPGAIGLPCYYSDAEEANAAAQQLRAHLYGEVSE